MKENTKNLKIQKSVTDNYKIFRRSKTSLYKTNLNDGRIKNRNENKYTTEKG